MTTIQQSRVVLWDIAGALWASGNNVSAPRPRLNSASPSDKGFVGSNVAVISHCTHLYIYIYIYIYARIGWNFYRMKRIFFGLWLANFFFYNIVLPAILPLLPRVLQCLDPICLKNYYDPLKRLWFFIFVKTHTHRHTDTYIHIYIYKYWENSQFKQILKTTSRKTTAVRQPTSHL